MHTIDPAHIVTVIDRFGGVRPTAAACGAPPSTVMSWKRKQKVPSWRWGDLLKAANERGIDLSDLVAIPAA